MLKLQIHPVLFATMRKELGLRQKSLLLTLIDVFIFLMGILHSLVLRPRYSIPTNIGFHRDYNNNNKVLLLVLIISSIVFTAIMILTFCYCCSCCRTCRSDCCQAIKKLLQAIFCCRCTNPYQEEIQRPSFEASLANINHHSEWRFDRAENPKLESTCSICLENRPSLQLSCGHIFHRQCILAWAQKRQVCALCRSPNFDNATVYCEQCLASNYKADLGKVASHLFVNRQCCEQCLQMGNH